MIKASCHTYEWVMSHIQMSHVTHMNVSCHLWLRLHVTHMNESCHTYEWVMSHIWMSHVTHMNESCHKWICHVTYKCVIPHMNASCRIWLSHVTYEWVCLCICLSLCLCISMSLCLHVFVSMGLFVCLSVCLCVCVSVCLCLTYEWVMSNDRYIRAHLERPCVSHTQATRPGKVCMHIYTHMHIYRTQIRARLEHQCVSPTGLPSRRGVCIYIYIHTNANPYAHTNMCSPRAPMCVTQATRPGEMCVYLYV